MWFKVENEYSEYLCSELSDSFLVSLIPFCVKHEYDIIVNGNISSNLYYQLNTYMIPMLCKKFKKRKINIECSLSKLEFDTKGVGASISCGVDSFYTLLKHKEQLDESYNITHLTFFNVGSHGEYGGDIARDLYNKRLIDIKSFCKENNYNLVTVDSNMNELIMMNHEKTHTFRTLSCVLALQKLFSKYYFASGLEFDYSHIDEEDTAYYDILNVKCLSNQNTEFFLSGMECSRMEKVEFISKFKETYNWLNVCVGNDSNNCGICNKCIRTMTALDSIGKLDKYKNVFDVEYFNKNRIKILGQMIKLMNNKITKKLHLEIIDSYKNNNIKIPKLSYIYAMVPTFADVKRLLKKVLPKSIINKLRKQKINDGWVD